MELSAIYHRPESEYAYLYKDKTMHIRIRTKRGDIESIALHYGDPFIFMEDHYEDSKEMVKVTSDALFDYWQVEVSVDYARLQYLFEITKETALSFLIFMKLMLVMYLTGFQRRSGIRFSQNALPMVILLFRQKGL